MDNLILAPYLNTIYIEEYTTKVKIIESKNINILHFNIRSSHKNFDAIKVFLNNLPKAPDIIALTETWLQKSTKHLYFLYGCESHSLVRANREHGAITIFIK